MSDDGRPVVMEEYENVGIETSGFDAPDEDSEDRLSILFHNEIRNLFNEYQKDSFPGNNPANVGNTTRVQAESS